MAGWTAPALGVGLLVITGVAGFFLEDRIVAGFLRFGRERLCRTAAIVLLTHLALLVAWVVVYAVAGILEQGQFLPVAPWLVVGMIMLHGPLVWSLMPATQNWATFEHRHDADTASYRAIYWTSAPFVLLGFGACVGAFLATFVR